MRNAILNASVVRFAPKARAISVSRIKPVMRESSVKPLTVNKAPNRSRRGRMYFSAGLGALSIQMNDSELLNRPQSSPFISSDKEWLEKWLAAHVLHHGQLATLPAPDKTRSGVVMLPHRRAHSQTAQAPPAHGSPQQCKRRAGNNNQPHARHARPAYSRYSASAERHPSHTDCSDNT